MNDKFAVNFAMTLCETANTKCLGEFSCTAAGVRAPVCGQALA